MTVLWSTNAKYSFAEELEFIYIKWNLKSVILMFKTPCLQNNLSRFFLRNNF